LFVETRAKNRLLSGFIVEFDVLKPRPYLGNPTCLLKAKLRVSGVIPGCMIALKQRTLGGSLVREMLLEIHSPRPSLLSVYALKKEREP
jgi:hypothetical protein